MNKSPKRTRAGRARRSAAMSRPFARYGLCALAASLLAAAGLWWMQARRPETVPAISKAVSFDGLKGRWQRPDGGYVIDIRAVEPGGQMDVGYYNPHPIHVARAQATQAGPQTRAVIELRDVNYPGSTYTLDYEAGRDQLSGIYYQAALQQQFQVVFVRMK